MPSTNDIRSGFLDFFQRHGHEVRPSGSLVPKDDPTLMFANAGMNQFKNVFTGAEKLPYSRAATAQKCVRAGGKHNDLDNVGYTARHHTFFEMLGNFSFGDYFKETAIELAWTLLTRDFGLNPDKLSVTVYHTDDEAFAIWKKLTGFDDSRIIRIPTSDNFWSMGDTGPCGPCSEIFYDHGAHIAGGPPGSPEQDGDRFIEIWNLVFMQYEQLPPASGGEERGGGERIALPRPSIDTGMGIERLAAVLQGVHDNYDIDLFRHLIAASKELSGNPGHDVSHRVIADHLRSSCFLIADGVLPSNEGRGYVLRRIMRRAMRHAHQLGCKEPLMHKLVPALVTEMGGAYPELQRAQEAIADNLQQEEERFKQTLDRGLKLLEEETDKLATGQPLSGEAAFKLYDTYGFPLDLTQDMLRTRGIEVDTAGFEASMEAQRGMARAAWSGSGEKAVGKLWFELKEKLGATEFVGYHEHESGVRLLAIVRDGAPVSEAGKDDEVSLIFDRTPFYGESGGQVGDTGRLTTGEVIFAEIRDAQKPVDGLIVHHARVLHPLAVGDSMYAVIDVERRADIRANHSATHLLHKALRDTLGTHVTQKGSLVGPDRLRFDFSHTRPVTREEIAKVEQRVNHIIWHNTQVETEQMAPDEAIKKGAMALFGEKYGETVRVLRMGKDNYSTELCGGTHVHATGDIGLFKITSESAVAAGVRRIEAVTREQAFTHLSQQENTLREMAGALKVSPADLPARVEQLSAERKRLEKELAEAKKQLALGGTGGGEVNKEMIGDIGFIGKLFDGLEPKELRAMAENYLKQAEPGVAFVATQVEGKATLAVAVSKALSEKISAIPLVQAAVAELGGKGGGGRPDMAQGGGPDVARLGAALERVKALLA